MTQQPHQIKGQQTAKRALEVAAVGGLSVLLVGPLGTSKTTLRNAFSYVTTDERETCACGHYTDANRECVCSPRQLLRWYRRLERTARDFDIIVECAPVPVKYLMARDGCDPREDDHRQARINAAVTFRYTDGRRLDLTDDTAVRMMEMAARRLGLTPNQYTRILKVARAVADLDGSPLLRGKHVAEAVQYRADATAYRPDHVAAEAAEVRAC